jgi:hypothetical protein
MCSVVGSVGSTLFLSWDACHNFSLELINKIINKGSLITYVSSMIDD